MGFKALNESEEQQSGSKETQEARETRIIQAYEHAMAVIFQGNDADGIVSILDHAIVLTVYNCLVLTIGALCEVMMILLYRFIFAASVSLP